MVRWNVCPPRNKVDTSAHFLSILAEDVLTGQHTRNKKQEARGAPLPNPSHADTLASRSLKQRAPNECLGPQLCGYLHASPVPSTPTASGSD